MDNLKKYKIASITGGALFILGLILCTIRASDIIAHKITTAKVLKVDEQRSECRRVSGKFGECVKAILDVEYVINKQGEKRVGQVEAERVTSGLQEGSEIKVMFLDGKPETVKMADFASGWKGPLGVFFLGSLILFISRQSRK